MDILELKTRLKGGNISGVFLLTGEEDYLIRYYLSELRRAAGVDPAFAVFNNPVYDGDGVSILELAEDLKAPPVMGERKIVEWRHARLSQLTEKELAALEELVESVSELGYATLAITAGADVLDLGTPKKPSSFVKRFGDKIGILNFPRSTDNQLYGWLKKHFDAEGVTVTLDVLRALVERSGHSMDVLVGEVDKLSALAFARGRQAISVEDVLEVASSTPESDTFLLSNAIIDKNKEAAYRALMEMKHRRVDPTVIMGMLARVWGDLLSVSLLLEEGKGVKDIETILKMNPYKLKIYIGAQKRYSPDKLAEIVSELSRVDADSKYGGVTGYTAVELLVSKFI